MNIDINIGGIRKHHVDRQYGKDAYIIHNEKHFVWDDPYVVVCT